MGTHGKVQKKDNMSELYRKIHFQVIIDKLNVDLAGERNSQLRAFIKRDGQAGSFVFVCLFVIALQYRQARIQTYMLHMR